MELKGMERVRKAADLLVRLQNCCFYTIKSSGMALTKISKKNDFSELVILVTQILLISGPNSVLVGTQVNFGPSKA